MSARRWLIVEIALVLFITFGLSGARSALSLIQGFIDGSLSSQQVALIRSTTSAPIIDAGFQILSSVQLFAWAGLVIFLLLRYPPPAEAMSQTAKSTHSLIKDMGLSFSCARSDLLRSVGLAMLIGIPGLCLYVLSVTSGINRTVIPADVPQSLHQVFLLLLNAAANACAEETVVVAYLLIRLKQLGWRPGSAVCASAVLRGSYHLYQGIGGGLGNIVMGLVFGWFYHRTQRLWPLIIAHFLIDAVAFLGYLTLSGKTPFF